MATTLTRLAKKIPVFDQGISALIEDLHERGLSDDVTVCVWGGIWSYAEDQQKCWTRPLAAGFAPRCLPVEV